MKPQSKSQKLARTRNWHMGVLAGMRTTLRQIKNIWNLDYNLDNVLYEIEKIENEVNDKWEAGRKKCHTQK